MGRKPGAINKHNPSPKTTKTYILNQPIINKPLISLPKINEPFYIEI